MTIIAAPDPNFVPEVNEPFARSLTDGVVLFIDSQGSWKVGKFGQSVSQYVSVSDQGHAKINDLTLDTTALSVAKGKFVGTYLLYAVSNNDSSKYFEYSLNANGQITGTRQLSEFELMGVENRLGEDLNGNGGIGAVDVVVNDSSEKLMATASGDLFVFKSWAEFVYLTVDGERLNLRDVGDLEFADVSFESDGSISTFLVSDDGDIFYQAFTAKGQADGNLTLIEADGDNTAALSTGVFGAGSRMAAAGSGSAGEGRSLAPNAKIYNSAQMPGAGAAAEGRTGTDLNRKSDTPLTDGWTAMLQTPSIKAVIEAGTANGALLNHGGVVALIGTALTAAGGDSKMLGETIVADLRAIAARGKALFTAKNVNGAETSYLAYVFDKIVNDSDANAFYTGGKEAKVNLGNLTAESTGLQLVALTSKWLLGGDLPSPQVQGDTANANAVAGSGVYASFSTVPLFVDGAQYGDINQGNAGTCYLMATLAAFAHSYADDVQSIFVQNATSTVAGGRTFGVRFFDLQGGEHWVTVNDQLVVPTDDQSTARYAQAKGVDAQGQAVPELWVALAEKAYAQFNELKINQREKADNGYGAVEGGNAEINVFMFNRDAVQYVQDAEAAAPGGINGISRMKSVTVPEGKTLLEVYTEALNAGRTLWVGSDIDIKDEAGKILFKGQHAHMVIDADSKNSSNTSVIAYNPWGVAGENANHRTPFEYDLAKLVGVKGIDIYVDVPFGG
jgi:hypothetical protein